MMTIGSLFSGIGGLELGLEAALGAETMWQVEQDTHCKAVLETHWPEAARYDDVRKVEALPSVDIVCGGFPCQDLSVAGKGEGLSGAKSGLWFEMLRIIREVKPRFVVAENVPGLIRRGLDVVVSGLADAGYEVEATQIEASDVGAPHKRRRVLILAYRAGLGCGEGVGRSNKHGRGDKGCREGRTVANSNSELVREQSGGLEGAPAQERAEEAAKPAGISPRVREATDAGRNGYEGEPSARREARNTTGGDAGFSGSSQAVISNPAAQPRVARDADGVSAELDAPLHGSDVDVLGHRWPMGRGATQYGYEPPRLCGKVANRTDRVRALGNAVVPQVAFVAGMRIRQLMEQS